MTIAGASLSLFPALSPPSPQVLDPSLIFRALLLWLAAQDQGQCHLQLGKLKIRLRVGPKGRRQ